MIKKRDNVIRGHFRERGEGLESSKEKTDKIIEKFEAIKSKTLLRRERRKKNT